MSSQKNVKVSKDILTSWDIEIYGFKIDIISQSIKELQAQKMLKYSTKFTDKRYEVGMLVCLPVHNLRNNYSSAHYDQLHSLRQNLKENRT